MAEPMTTAYAAVIDCPVGEAAEDETMMMPVVVAVVDGRLLKWR